MQEIILHEVKVMLSATSFWKRFTFALKMLVSGDFIFQGQIKNVQSV